jgi:hypothetical protein
MSRRRSMDFYRIGWGNRLKLGRYEWQHKFNYFGA